MSGDGINQGETTDTTTQDEENDEISTNDEKSVTEDSDTSEDSSESTERHSSNTNIDEEQPLIYLDDDTLKLNEHIEDRIRNLQKVKSQNSYLNPDLLEHIHVYLTSPLIHRRVVGSFSIMSSHFKR